MAKIKRRTSKLSSGRSKTFNGDLRPLGFILLSIPVLGLMFVFVGGFRNWVISIVAKIVDTLILSNLFVFNLVIILIIILIIIGAIWMFRRL